MKGKIIVCIGGLLWCSCNTSKGVIGGSYEKKGRDFEIQLKLNSIDSSFSLSEKYFDGTPTCNGIWNIKSDTLYLLCNEEKSISILLSSGYTNERVQKAIIITNNKLKLHNVVLKRHKHS